MTDEPEHKTTEIKIARPEHKQGLNVCVFCSANELPEKYTVPAEKFARLLAQHGHTLVWGGSDVGLMKLVASGAQNGGARIIGVSVEFLKHKARENADEMIFAKNLGDRKAAMLERSDVIVVLIGGTGTFDELTEILEYKRHGHHNKPVVILNTDNFYSGLQLQFQTMEQEGMLTQKLDQLMHFSMTPEDAINYINRFLNI